MDPIVVHKLMILFGDFTFSCGTYIVWFSRKNINANLSIGFVLIAYLLPLFNNTVNQLPPGIVNSFSWMMFLGGMFYVLGLLLGFNLKPLKFKIFSFEKNSNRHLKPLELKLRTSFLLILIGIPLIIAAIGFVPAFASDPLAAKYFRDQYALNPVNDTIFRSLFLIMTIISVPILYLAISRRSFRYSFMFLILILFISAFLERGAVGFSGLVVLALFSFNSNLRFSLFLVGSLFLYGLGTDLNAILYSAGFLHGSASFFAPQTTILEQIQSGADDTYEQLQVFLNFVQDNENFTLGRTLVGGLIPGHYEWNPAVWTLNILHFTSIDSAVTGGVRMTPALAGFISYGWLGTAGVCAASGFLQGRATKWLKWKFDSVKSNEYASYYFLFYYYLIEKFVNFWNINYIDLVSVSFVLFLFYRIKFKENNMQVAA